MTSLASPLRIQLLPAVVVAAFLSYSSCGSDGPTTPPVTTPTTTPGTTPPAASCSLGRGSVSATCGYAAPELSRYVEAAIDLLVRETTGIVDRSQTRPVNTDQYKILDAEKLLDTLVVDIQRQGLCAERDADALGLRRIVLKNSNGFSETYDVISPYGYLQRRQAAYASTCTPAAFPIDRGTADVPPAGSGCGRPYPPPISRFGCKVHLRATEYYTGDATPQVGPNREYCAAIGFLGQTICPVRREGGADRIACENWRVGKAKDTGRYGPTWTTLDGRPCTGRETNCSNSPDNQYQVRVYVSGKVHAAAENGAECTLTVDR